MVGCIDLYILYIVYVLNQMQRSIIYIKYLYWYIRCSPRCCRTVIEREREMLNQQTHSQRSHTVSSTSVINCKLFKLLNLPSVRWVEALLCFSSSYLSLNMHTNQNIVVFKESEFGECSVLIGNRLHFIQLIFYEAQRRKYKTMLNYFPNIA